MALQEQDSLYVIAATYDDVAAAVADYDSVTELCGALRTPHDFDAAVIAKDENGTVRIVKKHAQPTRRGAAVGGGWGLATGIVGAIFSPVSTGTAGGAGAATGGIAGHASGGKSRGDLKNLGEALDEGRAGLVALLRVEPGRSDRREHQGGGLDRLQGHRHGHRPSRCGPQADRGGVGSAYPAARGPLARGCRDAGPEQQRTVRSETRTPVADAENTRRRPPTFPSPEI